MDASWRFESPISWLLLDGILSSTGETKPSASSSSWSKKLRTLKSVFMVIVRSGFTLLSSSDPSSSSYTQGQSTPTTREVIASLLRNRLLSPHALGTRNGKAEQTLQLPSSTQDTRRPSDPGTKAWQRNCHHKLRLVKETQSDTTEWKKIPGVQSNLLLCLVFVFWGKWTHWQLLYILSKAHQLSSAFPCKHFPAQRLPG